MCKFIHTRNLFHANSGLIIYLFKIADGWAIIVAGYVYIVMVYLLRVGDMTEITTFSPNCKG